MSEAREKTLSPSELNRQVRSLLESHYGFVWVTGEISNFAAPSSGHWYFSLKDDNAQVRCAMFKGRNQRLRFRPKNGDAVRLRARVSLYEGRGEFQLIGEHLEPAGAGELQARFEALRDRLRDEGLFDADRKKPLPEHIAHLAVITSPTGAALQDILTVLKRRSPLTHVTVLPATVQGQDAAPQLCAALEQANRLASDYAFDAIIIGRGGGSIEDLWAFNEESVARAIAASDLPVISGVGHEVDVTIADFAADIRAPTPSAAAELVSDDIAELEAQLRQLSRRLGELTLWRLERSSRELRHLRQRLVHPGVKLREQSQRLDELELRLREHIDRRLRADTHRLEMLRLRINGASPWARLVRAQERLNTQQLALGDTLRRYLDGVQRKLHERSGALTALNPLAILARGYAVLTKADGSLLRSSEDVAKGDQIHARLGQGSLDLTVKEAPNAGRA